MILAIAGGGSHAPLIQRWLVMLDCCLVLRGLAGCETSHPVVDHSFSCGSLMCNSSAQACLIANSNLPGGHPTYACVASDGGAPSCDGSIRATAPGMCGCYISQTGEVTTTLCPP